MMRQQDVKGVGTLRAQAGKALPHRGSILGTVQNDDKPEDRQLNLQFAHGLRAGHILHGIACLALRRNTKRTNRLYTASRAGFDAVHADQAHPLELFAHCCSIYRLQRIAVAVRRQINETRCVGNACRRFGNDLSPTLIWAEALTEAGLEQN